MASVLKHLPGRLLWRTPFPYGLANMLNRRYSLRCVLFHDVADETSPFTRGLGLTVSRKEFENRIRFLAQNYVPVTLDEVLKPKEGPAASRRPMLLTFDDAYASVALEAAPICEKYGLPAVFFVNARYVDNRELALDNLVCYIANTRGFEVISAAARESLGMPGLKLESFAQVFWDLLPQLSLDRLERFRTALADTASVNPAELAREAGLYVTTAQLRALAAGGFEIGNHTYSHSFGRALRGNDFSIEIHQNKSLLEALTGKPVRAFSVPYGSYHDLPDRLVDALRDSDHSAAFLAGSLANTRRTDRFHFDRLSVESTSDADFFSELEVLPRLRCFRDALRRTRPNPPGGNGRQSAVRSGP